MAYMYKIYMLNIHVKRLSWKDKKYYSGYEGKFKTGCDDIIEKSIK
jgi:hypothetical protein